MDKTGSWEETGQAYRTWIDVNMSLWSEKVCTDNSLVSQQVLKIEIDFYYQCKEQKCPWTLIDFDPAWYWIHHVPDELYDWVYFDFAIVSRRSVLDKTTAGYILSLGHAFFHYRYRVLQYFFLFFVYRSYGSQIAGSLVI